MSISVRIDLRAKFGPARDQKRRLTCIAFAASDAHAAQRTSPFQPLSAEYAFYHACRKRVVFDPHAGVGMSDILMALENDGQPEENGWPYLEKLPTDIAQYKPPQNIGSLYHRAAQREFDLGVLSAMLTAGRAPLIAMNISHEFFLARTDEVLRAPASSPTVGRHALVVVGMGEEQNEQVFLVRNSWGEGWADHGYAWISRGYLEPRLISIGVMKI